MMQSMKTDLVLAGEMCFFKKLSELLFPLFQLVALLSPFFLRPFLHVLLEHLLALLGCQQQVAWVEDDLVQLLLPRRESRYLLTATETYVYTFTKTWQQICPIRKHKFLEAILDAARFSLPRKHNHDFIRSSQCKRYGSNCIRKAVAVQDHTVLNMLLVFWLHYFRYETTFSITEHHYSLTSDALQ